MEEVDNIILPILREQGCQLSADITSIKQLDAELFFHASAVCVNVLARVSLDGGKKQGVTFPNKLPSGKAARFRVCSSLSAELKNTYQYTGSGNSAAGGEEIGYETFLYPNEQDMRKLLRWLVDRIQKGSSSSSATTTVSDVSETTTGSASGADSGMQARIQTSLKSFIKQKWSPLTYQPQVLAPTFPVHTIPLTYAHEKVSEPTLHYFNNYFKPISHQVVHTSHSWTLPTAPVLVSSLLEQNHLRVILSQEAEARWAAQAQAEGDAALALSDKERERVLKERLNQAFRLAKNRHDTLLAGKGQQGDLANYAAFSGMGAKTAFGRRTDFETDKNDSNGANTANSNQSEEKSDDAIREERERALEELQGELNDLLDQAKKMDQSCDNFAALHRNYEADIATLTNTITSMEDAYKIKKRTLDLLPEAQKNLQELTKLVEASSQRLAELGQEWENHRIPLVNKLRRQKQLLAERKDEVGRKVEQIKRMRNEMKEKANDLREKDRLYQTILEELNAMPKSINRQIYVRRIMDIMKNIDKQKDEIKKILQDVRATQKEINLVSASSRRSFAVADEVIFQAAKKNIKDEFHTKSYKYVIQMKDGFEALVTEVEKTGKTQNEIRDLQSQIDDIESRNTNLNMERILNDLAQVKKENKALAAKLKQ